MPFDNCMTEYVLTKSCLTQKNRIITLKQNILQLPCNLELISVIAIHLAGKNDVLQEYTSLFVEKNSKNIFEKTPKNH